MMTKVPSIVNVRETIEMIEHSELPLADDSNFISTVKAKIVANEPISEQEYNRLVKVAEKAEKWETQVESSARTDPEDTLPG